MTHSTDLFRFPLISLDETDSTNRYLTQYCNEHPAETSDFTTVVADFQTAGKGQRGNSWESEKGKNLMFSIAMFPTFIEAKNQFVLSEIVSLAVKEELDTCTDDISIKWPNDIYWNEKKICGILIEHELEGRCLSRSIAGIGLNINQEVFRSNAPNPVSLRQITGHEHDRTTLLQGILTRLHRYYTQLQQEGNSNTVDMCYHQSLFRREGYHPYQDNDGRFMARLLRVEPDGRLVLEDEGGRERSYLFKQVQHIL